MIELGDKVEDVVTGFTGIATAKYLYLHGCARFNVQPAVLDKEMKLPKSHVFDEPQLKVVEQGK